MLKFWRGGLLVLLAFATALLLWPRSPLLYVLRQGRFQGELLWGRVDVEVALEKGLVVGKEADRLRQVKDIKAFGEAAIGLHPTLNYETINPAFKRVVFNVSACQPTRFQAVTWWFPIVGTVPYLGFFDEDDAEEEAGRLRAQGLDVRVRTAGAYSTLGWFRDPLTIRMLGWELDELANTVLHELTHATLFIPGEVDWNESFANFVGDEASWLYLSSREGRWPEAVAKARRSAADGALVDEYFSTVFHRLDTLYRQGGEEGDVLQAKARILSEETVRFGTLPFQGERVRTLLRRQPLNNASLMNWRRYHQGKDDFAEVLRRCQGKLPVFIALMNHVVRPAVAEGEDPFAVAAKMAGRPGTGP